MKKVVVTTLILLALTLTACGSSLSWTSTGSNSQALSARAELILGSLKLDGSAQAVTKEQAAQLLPLWITMKELQTSDTAAQQEIDGLTKQIKENMTAEQLQVIAGMKLTTQDASDILQTSVSSTQTRNSQSQSSSGTALVGNPAGGPPGGDPLSEITGASVSSQTSTTSSVQSKSTTTDQISLNAIDTLIKLLEKKAAS